MIAFDDFVQDVHALFTTNPNKRVALGLLEGLGRLPDPSHAARLAHVAAARALLARLPDVDTAGLTFDQRLDLDLARLSLQREIHLRTYTFNGRTMAHQKPSAGDDIGDGIFLMFINDPRPAAARLDDILGRIQGIPDYLDALLARLDTPVARWVNIDAEKIEGLPELLQTVADWAEGEGYPQRDALRSAIEAAKAAMHRYQIDLRALPTTTQLHVGDETARQLVAYRGIDRSLEELHAYAARFLQQTGEQIEALRGRLIEKHGLKADTSVEALHEYLNRTFAVDVAPDALDEVLDVYRAERDRVRAFIKERDLFPILDGEAMKIIRTPDFMAPSIPAGAMMPPAPFREGTKTSMVYLTLSEELLDEHTRLGIPVMMIHEGIPGHHLQLATAAAHDSVIRRHVDAAEQAEGWTTMLEDYMLDQGYLGDLTDEARFITKRDLSRIGARVAIDLFFMTGDRRYLDVGRDVDVSDPDPFVAAGRLLKAVTGFTDGRVQAELNWYSQERAYPLSYLTGNVLVWELKRDVQAAKSGEDTLDIDRAFHRTFLEAGNMPMSFVRRVFAHQGLIA